MEHFTDIQLLPDSELPAHVLLSALCAKLHRALVLGDNNASGIAICFPGYKLGPGAVGLGNSLRLLGSEPALQALTNSLWLGSLRDQVSVTGLAEVPPGAVHRSLRRAQAKSNPERLRRRLVRRHGISDEEARRRIPDSAAKLLNLPFLQLRSTSTGQGFRLFLKLSPTLASVAEDTFNTYGLSANATIPWF